MKSHKWFYVLRNKTSGKLYFGQTTSDIRTYLGSGPYWKSHNNIHGGHTRENIETLWCEFVESDDVSEGIVSVMRESEGEYWLYENKKWANRVEETAELTSPFKSITQEQRKKNASKGGKVAGKARGSDPSNNIKNMTSEEKAKAGRKGGLANGKPFMYRDMIFPSKAAAGRYFSEESRSLEKKGGSFL